MNKTIQLTASLVIALTAISLQQLSTAAEPTPSAAAVARGNALRDKKQIAEAIAAYTEAIQADKNNAMAYVERATTYAEKGDYTVVVKVIDILGNDTTKTVKVKVK